MGSFFYRSHQWIASKKWGMFFALILVLVSLSALATRIQFDDDISALIPQNEESKKIQEVLKSIAFTDKIIVNISRSPEASIDELTRYATDFLDSIQESSAPYIKNIQGKLNDQDLPNTLNLVYNNLPLFLDEDDYTIIQQRLQKDSITQRTEENYRTLTSPSGIITKKNIVKDPLGLTFIALKKLQQLGIGDEFKLKNGFLLDKKEQNILLFITPTHASGATDENAPFVENLYALQEQFDKRYGSRVRSDYFGAALVAVANAKQIKKDIQFTASIALLVLMVILVLFYRKLALPIILFIPTLFGGLLAIALLYVIRTKISAISLGIGSVLLGVTLDYSLHILTHIRNGNSLRTLFNDVAPSILMSSLTTASAFLCLLFLKSQALQDLGIFAATSVLGASVFALLFIPQVYRYTAHKASRTTLLDQIAAYDFHKNKYAIGFVGILLIISMFTYRTVIFNHDIAKLNFESEVLTQARERLEKLTDIGSKSIYLSTFGEDREAVLQKNDALFQQLNQLKSKNEIVSFSSVGALLSSDKKQLERIKAWKDFWDPEKIGRTKQNLIESGNTLGFKETTFAQFYERLRADFYPMKVSDLEVVSSFAVNDFMVSDSLSTTVTSLIKVDDAKAQHVRDAFQGEDRTLVIDRKQVNETFLGNLKNDFSNLIWYSLLAVIALLIFFYRSFSLTLITGIPLILSWLMTIGLMGLFKIEFNIFNIIISSFIFGLGVDYSIFITNGLLTQYRTGEKTLPSHKTSILLSVITTLLGIGVLVFAKHPALYSVSVVCVIGILAAALVSFTVQPLLFHLFLGSTTKRPITPKYLVHSLISFGYFDLGGLLLSAYAKVVLKLDPKRRLKKQLRLHQVTSKFMKSVLYTNPFVSKKVLNPHHETFEKPAMLIANHASFLDILAMGMLYPKLIYLVKDHVYNSPIVGSAARLHGAYPVSQGIESGAAYLTQKLEQGFSIIAFPEGSRSTTNKIGRFHKGAFYLAEKLGLDILPILIHGTAEVSPKNSFIIRDGSITLEILPRIKAEDTGFGETYAQRPKQIGQYFRSEFRRLRNAIEHETYWHKLILENYRYKGDAIYKSVKKDLKTNKEIYISILRAVGYDDRIVHLSNNMGQLDLLLALDAIDRKIFTYIKNEEVRAIVKNNYLTHQYSKISVMDSAEEALGQDANVLIITLEPDGFESLENRISSEIAILIVITSSVKLVLDQILDLGFEQHSQNDRFLIAKRGKV